MKRLFLLLSLVAVAGCKTGGQHAEDISGDLDKEAIRATLRTHAKDILSCYDTELEKKPDLQGQLVMQWDIVEKGKTANVRVAKPFETAVDDCVALKIEQMTFPIEVKKDKVSRVVFPFNFSSKEAAEKKDEEKPADKPAAP